MQRTWNAGPMMRMALLALVGLTAAVMAAPVGSPTEWLIGGHIGPDATGNVVLQSQRPIRIMSNSVLFARDGAHGTNATGVEAIGGNGLPGGSIRLAAPAIVFEPNVTLVLGHGGDGGLAMAQGWNAWAQGGAGGAGGQLVIEGLVAGAYTVKGGDGGAGGHAGAKGEDACDARPGEPDEARGGIQALGDGESAEAEGRAGHCGPPGSTGGDGGNATAFGGDGGLSLNGNGGRGGDATALAGQGGKGADACATSLEELDEWLTRFSQAGNGGRGGRANATGGNGAPGVIGGDGGFATAISRGGHGGNGTWYAVGSRPPISIRPGTGGWLIPGASTGGKGGPGDVGGNGGGAYAESVGGNSGSPCSLLDPPNPKRSAPAGVEASAPGLLLTMVAVVSRLRRR